MMNGAPTEEREILQSLAVCTANFAGYDDLAEPFECEGVRFICFADKELNTPGWEYRIMEVQEQNPRMQAGRCKILLHEYVETEYSVWIDANLEMLRDPTELLAFLGRYDFVTFLHPHRDCTYEEAKACKRFRRWHEAIPDQIARYREEGYPEHAGLAEVRAVVRRHTENANWFCAQWWKEIQDWSSRSQISLTYLAWKYGYPMWLLPASLRRDFFKQHFHASGRK